MHKNPSKCIFLCIYRTRVITWIMLSTIRDSEKIFKNIQSSKDEWHLGTKNKLFYGREWARVRDSERESERESEDYALEQGVIILNWRETENHLKSLWLERNWKSEILRLLRSQIGTSWGSSAPKFWISSPNTLTHRFCEKATFFLPGPVFQWDLPGPRYLKAKH